MRDKKKTKGNNGDGKFPGGGVGGGGGVMMGGGYDKGGDERRDGTTDVVVGRNGWGIREAIHNIDRVFMDKRNRLFPPDPRRAPLPPPPSREYELTAEDDATVSESSSLLPMVIGDTLPENADAIDDYAYSPIPASDALECRSSVISFVINATDVKDECDGLRRAFDKACSVQETTTNPITTWGGSPESETEKAENSPSRGEEGGGYYDDEDRDPDRRGGRRRRRRMLGRIAPV